MIKLFEEDKREIGRKSSKGNQLKFFRDGFWIIAMIFVEIFFKGIIHSINGDFAGVITSHGV